MVPETNGNTILELLDYVMDTESDFYDALFSLSHLVELNDANLQVEYVYAS